MKKSGLADSPFFTQPQTEKPVRLPPQVELPPLENKPPTTPLPQPKISGELTQGQDNENQDQKRSFDRTTERSIVRTVIKYKREKVRHTFDVYKDQLIALQVIQLERVQSGKKKPKLGKMVSEGIDLYLKKEASKKNRA